MYLQSTCQKTCIQISKELSKLNSKETSKLTSRLAKTWIHASPKSLQMTHEKIFNTVNWHGNENIWPGSLTLLWIPFPHFLPHFHISHIYIFALLSISPTILTSTWNALIPNTLSLSSNFACNSLSFYTHLFSGFVFLHSVCHLPTNYIIYWLYLLVIDFVYLLISRFWVSKVAQR